ncbi:MAG: nuclear transport factor 2 family protein [Bacteroidales bacterium]|nr:nuclear transport factor 2 family protein [Bacteroidales bacterium]MBN2698626.1 nuclear transport factor 2 family protein [Bacteroidales bacterium]
MKKLLLSVIVFGLVAGYSCQGPVDPEAEKEAIKAVIETEKAAFFEQDLEKIDGTWKQDTLSRKIYADSEGYWEIKGWKALQDENKQNLREDRGDFSKVDLKFTDYEIVLYDNTALVFHVSNWSGIYQGEELLLVQKRILHLVKEDGSWKIDLMFMYRMPGEDEEDEDSAEESD